MLRTGAARPGARRPLGGSWQLPRATAAPARPRRGSAERRGPASRGGPSWPRGPRTHPRHAGAASLRPSSAVRPSPCAGPPAQRHTPATPAMSAALPRSLVRGLLVASAWTTRRRAAGRGAVSGLRPKPQRDPRAPNRRAEVALLRQRAGPSGSPRGVSSPERTQPPTHPLDVATPASPGRGPRTVPPSPGRVLPSWPTASRAGSTSATFRGAPPPRTASSRTRPPEQSSGPCWLQLPAVPTRAA
mmetsp:Transcript_108586/g.346140  ORF Transcript_108586/g.346140 Transcript_108586/m.346140 type:complete len:245 (-) Transcript_108586:609-1343(-)